MSYPCGVIEDLLPSYIDGIATDDTTAAVEEHLRTCQACRDSCEAMRATEFFDRKKTSEDGSLAESLKKVKRKLDKKMRRIVFGAVAAALVLLGSSYLLFQAPVRNIGPEDVRIAVECYAIEDLVAPGSARPGSVIISDGEKDTGAVYGLTIPSMPGAVAVTESILEKCEYVSVLTVTSPYLIRQIHFADREEAGVVYIEAFKTTVLHNKAPEQFQTTKTLDFRDVEQVIFLQNGQERVLWSK